MPSRLKRYHGTEHLHFITFTCYEFVVVGYVVVPEHVHLLISEAEKSAPSRVIQAVKQGFARHALRPWRQRRKHGQTIYSRGRPITSGKGDSMISTCGASTSESKKLRYMHENPVKRGLVQEPEQWT